MFFLCVGYTDLEVIRLKFEYEPGRIYVSDPTGDLLAEVTFPRSGSITDINHTYVHSSLRGQGVADKLLSAAVSQIRSDGLKARATCTYAIKWFEEHPEQSDLLVVPE